MNHYSKGLRTANKYIKPNTRGIKLCGVFPSLTIEIIKMEMLSDKNIKRKNCQSRSPSGEICGNTDDKEKAGTITISFIMAEGEEEKVLLHSR